MSMNHKLPLHSLLVRMEQAGFTLDPSTQYNIQEVLHRLGKDYLDQPEQLRRLIGPIVANNPQEQMLFQEVFDSYWKEVLTVEQEMLIADTEENYVEEEIDETAIKKAVKKRREWAYPVGLLIIVGLFTSIFLTNSQNVKEVISDQINGEHKQVKVESHLPQVPKSEESELLMDTWAHPDPINGQPPSFEKAGFSLDRETYYKGESIGFAIYPIQQLDDQQKLILDFGDGTTTSDSKFKHTYETGGFYEVKLLLGNEKIASKWITVYPEYLSPIAQKQASLEAISDKQNDIKWQIVLLAFLLIVGIESYLERYRKKMYQLAFEQEFQAKEHGPYQLNFPETSQKLKAEPELYQLANRLKQRKLTGLEVLDIPATLYETVRAGGFPTFAYAPTSKQTEYLILLDQSGPTDQQAKLFAQFVDLLKAEEVPVQAYNFRNDPQICYNEQYPEGIAIDVLAQRNPEHRLIIFSKGSYWIDIRNHKLKEWIAPIFASWKQRIMLTPEAVKHWGNREDLLQEVFTLFPADLETQQGIVEALLGHEDELLDFQASLLARRVVDEPLKDYDFNKAEDLRDYLGESLFEWLMATMVYPQPSWEMTLKIGESLEAEGLVMADGSKLVTYDNLLKLSNIPWLQEAEAPASLRKELLAELDPEVEEIARHAVLELLDEVKAAPATPAFTEKRIQQTVQQAALEPENKKLQSKLKYLWQNNLLNAATKSSLKKEIKPGLLERLGGALPYHAVFYVMLPLLGLGYVGYRVYWHSTEEVFERYFRPFPMGENAYFYSNDKVFPNYKKGDYKKIVDSYENPIEIEQYLLQMEVILDGRDKEIDVLDELYSEIIPPRHRIIENIFYFSVACISEQEFDKAKYLISGLEYLEIKMEPLNWYLLLSDLDHFNQIHKWMYWRYFPDHHNPYYHQAQKLTAEMTSFWHWY